MWCKTEFWSWSSFSSADGVVGRVYSGLWIKCFGGCGVCWRTDGLFGRAVNESCRLHGEFWDYCKMCPRNCKSCKSMLRGLSSWETCGTVRCVTNPSRFSTGDVHTLSLLLSGISASPINVQSLVVVRVEAVTTATVALAREREPSVLLPRNVLSLDQIWCLLTHNALLTSHSASLLYFTGSQADAGFSAY